MSQRLRVLFIGQNHEFSLAPLRAVCQHFQVVGIVESAPRGATALLEHSWRRKVTRLIRRLMGKANLELFARAQGVPFFFLTRDKMDGLIEFLQQLQPDVGCIVSMSQLLPKSVLALPPHGFLNVHPSLLPLYRGPNPWFWHYYDGVEQAGVTVHVVDEGEDSGDIVVQASFPMALGLEPQEFVQTCTRLGAELLVEALSQIARGTVSLTPQKHLPCPRRARNVRPGEVQVEWEQWPLERVFHLLRGGCYWQELLPSPHGRRHGWVWEVLGMEREVLGSFVHRQEGGVICADQQGYFVTHPEGKIRLRRRFSWKRWLRAIAVKLQV